MMTGHSLPSADLTALCQSLNEGSPLLTILKQLVGYAAEWTQSDNAELVLEDSALRHPFHAANIKPLRDSDGTTLWIKEERKPLIVPDLNYAPFDADVSLHERGFSSYAGVPVGGQQVIGALYIHNRTPRDYSRGEVAALETLAALAALAISRQQLQNRLEESHRTMVRFALIDPLTNLASQRHFEYIYKREWQRSTAEVLPLSLLKLELDNVPPQEGRIGPERQRKVLFEVARVLDGALYRPSDLAARLSQTTFIVLLPNTNAQGAKAIAERLIRELRQLKLTHPQKERQLVTVSIGVSSYQPLALQSYAASADELLAQADKALSQARERGGDGIAVAGG